MRMLIDSTQIPLARTGVGIYAEQLIKELTLILRPEDILFVLIQTDDAQLQKLIAGQAYVRPILIPSYLFRNRLALAFYEQCILPWVLLFYHIDIVHSLHYTFPLICPCSRVVTIHDMTFLLWPEMHTRSRRIVMPFFTKMALRHAECVLFVSGSTQKDAEEMFGIGSNLRSVTPHGVDQAYFSPAPMLIERTLSHLSIHQPYILFLGTLEPRKNLVRLIQAFESFAERCPHILVIAGGLGWNYEAALQSIERSSIKKRIVRLGYVSAVDKIPLIAGCDLLVYPSLYEGFGLPVLEGMAAGVPVVTSNTSSLPEVAGRAAVLVNPSSADEIAKAMHSVLSDKRYSDWLRQAGREQARKFTWVRTATLTYAAYRKAFTKAKPACSGKE